MRPPALLAGTSFQLESCLGSLKLHITLLGGKGPERMGTDRKRTQAPGFSLRQVNFMFRKELI